MQGTRGRHESDIWQATLSFQQKPNEVVTAKSVINGITPPYAIKAVKTLLNNIDPKKREFSDVLFEGNDRKFKQLAKQSKVYFEYGCGKSTIWCSHNIQGKIFSVDTSEKWVKNVTNRSSSKNIPQLRWVDCGDVGSWGTPTGYSKRHNFREYILGPFKVTSERPDLILIDGRFRVACFLNSLLRSSPGTHIIFDDYTERPEYHVVEEVCKKTSLSGRQAIFIAPEFINRELIQKEMENFSYVMN